MKRSTKLFTAPLGLTIAGAMVVSGCAGPSDGGTVSDDGLAIVRMQGVVADPMGVPVLLIEEMGLDTKHGFDLEWQEGDPAGGTQPFLMGQAELGPGDGVSAAIANAEGHDTVAYYPFMTNTASIVASADSGIRTPEDLRGKRVGHFGSDSGTTQAITLTLADGWGIDVDQDLELVESSPAVLPELLAQGEVDAIFDYEPYGDRAMQLTDGTRLLEVATYWQGKSDWAPPLAMLWSNRTWLEENPEVAQAVVAAFTEAQQIIIDAGYSTFTQEPYKSFLDLADDAELDRLVAYCNELPCYTNEWGDEDVANMNDWLAMMRDQGMLPETVGADPIATVDTVTAGG